jgi:hypothetical protein
MLGGAKITERTREHAREMLEGSARRTTPPDETAKPASAGAGSSRARSGRARSANGR